MTDSWIPGSLQQLLFIVNFREQKTKKIEDTQGFSVMAEVALSTLTAKVV